ncbi:MAG TPA: hypothetical protein VFM58_01045 [Solirubrobacteraceae bacterium]|nr:hypothetical protein [Solirubrobacteraceae bacterium]
MTTTQTASVAGRGAYGFRLVGVDAAADLLVDAPGDWPALTLEHAPPPASRPRLDRLGPHRAELPLHGGSVTIEREPPRVTFRLPERPGARDLVHPYLAPAAAVAARWARRESFHAGAVIAGDGAWAILGDKESGKSTTLAHLALAGHGIVSDDLLVVDRDAVFAGPRCVDLRAASAAHLEAGEPLGVVGVRERWRLGLAAIPARVPLRGWVTLAWDDDVGVDVLRGADRVLALLPFRSVQVTPDAPEDLVDLGSLPVLRLRRPRRWDALDAAAERLLAAVA